MTDPSIKVVLVNVTSFALMFPRLMHRMMQAVKYLCPAMLRDSLLYLSSISFVADSVRDPGGSRLNVRLNGIATFVQYTCVL